MQRRKSTNKRESRENIFHCIHFILKQIRHLLHYLSSDHGNELLGSIERRKVYLPTKRLSGSQD